MFITRDIETWEEILILFLNKFWDISWLILDSVVWKHKHKCVFYDNSHTIQSLLSYFLSWQMEEGNILGNMYVLKELLEGELPQIKRSYLLFYMDVSLILAQ